MSRFLVFSLLLVIFSKTASAQINVNQQLFNSMLGSMLDRFGSNPTATKPRCVPFPLPGDYTSLQSFCKALSVARDSEWEAKYKNGAGPETIGTAFPLKGEACFSCFAMVIFISYYYWVRSFHSVHWRS